MSLPYFTSCPPDSGQSSSPSCHMLRWGEVSCLSVHLSDMTGNVLHFCIVRDSYRGFSWKESNQNADIMLVSVIHSTFP